MKKSIFGYGTTTKAIAKEGGFEIFDDKFKEISTDEFGNKLLPVDKFDPNLSELEITSPGINPDHKLIKSAKNLISEYDYFANFVKYPIFISGTNGKTTTTKMTQFLLKDFGSVMGGNVGIPVGDLRKDAKFYILETSSFMLHYTNSLAPKIYALLPITPDHISWHKSFDNYEFDKLKPLSIMEEGSIAIIPKKYENQKSLAKIIGYEDEFDLAKSFNIDIDQIKFKTPFLLDAVMALSIQKILLDKIDINKLNSFVIENNKLEEFYDRFNRLWVNDTKATNIDATIQAIKRYKDKKIHIILGGDGKGVSMKDIIAYLKNFDTHIYAIGTNCDEIMNLAKEFEIPAIRCEIIDNAINYINENMGDKNEVGLLSPACASLDQFSSYVQRGDKFKELVNKI